MPFWPFSRRKESPPLTAAQLQQKLVEVATTHSTGELRHFCKKYQRQIATHANVMNKAPLEIRGNRAEMSRFIQGLGTAAQCLANELGDSTLWDVLVGNPRENPLMKSQKFIDGIPERMKRGEHKQLIDELRPLLADFKKLEGGAARQIEAILQGRLGELLFHSGKVGEARTPMEAALAMCDAAHDQVGVCAYLGNLVEVARYQGDQAEAIRCSERLATELKRLGKTDELADVERQLRLLRSGEPLCRIACRRDGRLLELDELPAPAAGKFDFEFVRNRPQIQFATALTEQAMAKASRGDFADAHELLCEASEVDPYDPNPRYQDGMVLMEMGLYPAARAELDKVEDLAPGWFRCRFDRWLADQLESGAAPTEAFQLLRVLEDGGLPPAEFQRLAAEAVTRFPTFAPFQLHRADSLRDSDRKAAESAYRRGLDMADEPDLESRLLCALAAILPAGSEERRRLVERAQELQGSLIASAVARIMGIN